MLKACGGFFSVNVGIYFLNLHSLISQYPEVRNSRAECIFLELCTAGKQPALAGPETGCCEHTLTVWDQAGCPAMWVADMRRGQECPKPKQVPDLYVPHRTERQHWMAGEVPWIRGGGGR